MRVRAAIVSFLSWISLCDADPLEAREYAVALPSGKSSLFVVSEHETRGVRVMRGTDSYGRRLVLIAGKHGPFGTVDSTSERWRIESNQKGTWIEGWRPSLIARDDVVVLPRELSDPANVGAGDSVATTSVTADLLLLYTFELASELRDENTVNERLVFLTELLNDTLAASQIAHRFNLVGIESSSISNDLDTQAALHILDTDAEAAVRRAAYGADVVMLIRRKTPTNGCCGGVANLFMGPSAEQRPFGVTDLTCVGAQCTAEDTFLHEMGHIMGGGHSVDDPWDYGGGWRPYAHAWVGCGLPQNGMPLSSIISRVGIPVRLYSSPTVVNEGVICGDVDTADNARTIRESLPYIAAFRDAPVGAAPAIGLVINPASVAAGESSNITWFALRATSCTASGDWAGTKSTEGTERIALATPDTRTYTLSCDGPGGSGRASATLTVTAARALQPAPPVPQTADSGGSGSLDLLSLLVLGFLGLLRSPKTLRAKKVDDSGSVASVRYGRYGTRAKSLPDLRRYDNESLRRRDRSGHHE